MNNQAEDVGSCINDLRSKMVLKTTLQRLVITVVLITTLSTTLLISFTHQAKAVAGGEIQSGETKNGNIVIEGQTDSYTFYGNVGQGVVIEMSAAESSNLGTAIYLYRPDGSLETKVVGDSFATRVRIEEHQLEQTGTYTIVATASQAYSTTATGGYGLSLVLIPGATTSAQDPDGGNIVSGQTHSASINPQGDTDAFAFQGQKGQGVVIEMSAAESSNLGTAIYLYRPDGSLETKVVGDSFATRVRIEDHQLEQTGTYTIVATASQAYSTTATGGYGLSLVLVGGAAGPTATHALTPTPVLTPTPTPFGSWSDDFDSYGTGAFPSSGGWVLAYSGLGSSYQYVDNSHSVSGTNALHLVGSSCWAATAYHALEMPSQVSFEAMVFIDAIVNCGCTNTIAAMGLYDPNLGTWGTEYGLVWFSCDGKIYAGPSTYNRQYDVALGSYQPRQWYHVQVRIDLVSRLFDVYINGTLCGSGLQVMDSGTPKGIEVGSAHGANPTAWFDDVKVSAAKPTPPEENTLTGVGTRNQISTDKKVVGTNIGLAIATILVFYLAATVFNNTIRENYDVIQGWPGQGSTRLRSLRTSCRKVIGSLRRVIGSKWMYYLEWILVVVVCAAIYLKLEPYFINTLRGSALFAALALGILIVTLAYEGTQVLVSGSRFSVPAVIRIYPIAILIALIFLLISIKIHFHPGLIYGFVGAYAALSISKSQRLNTKQRAITIVLGVGAILAVCVGAFFLREFVIHHWAGESFARMLIEDILVAAIAIGLESLLFSIALPFTFSDGKKILDWNFWVWYVCAGLVVFAFWELIINHDKRLPEAVKTLNSHLMFGLMGITLLISTLIYLIFWLWKKRLHT